MENNWLKEPSDYYGTLKNYINGEWIDSKSVDLIDVINPALDKTIAQVPLSTGDEVKEAVKAAREAFWEWRETPPTKRASYFFKLKNLLEDNFEKLSRIIVQELGENYCGSKGGDEANHRRG